MSETQRQFGPHESPTHLKKAGTGNFLEPSFLVSGGGISNHQYDSRAANNSIVMSDPVVLGIAER